MRCPERHQEPVELAQVDGRLVCPATGTDLTDHDFGGDLERARWNATLKRAGLGVDRGRIPSRRRARGLPAKRANASGLDGRTKRR